MKTDYSYPSKKRMRAELKQSIDNWIPNKSDSRVVCFPGAGALEVLEVYDPLGIPRSNIIGIERDKTTYETLRSMNLGISLWNGEATDFFSRNNDEFNIVSLDYTQLPSLDTLGIVRNLFVNRNFRNKALLYTNFYAKRINEFSKHNLLYVEKYKVHNPVSSRGVWETSMKSWTWKDIRKRMSLRQFRSDALSQFLISCSGIGESMIDLILNQEKVKTFAELFEKNSEEYIEKTVVKPRVPTISEKEVFSAPGGRKFRCNKLGLSDLTRTLFINVETGEQLHNDYFVESLKRFEYVSDDRSLMFSDIMYIDRGDDIVERFSKAVKGFGKAEKRNYTSKEERASLIPRGNSRDEFVRNKLIIEKCGNEQAQKSLRKTTLLTHLPPRKVINIPCINKKEAIKLLKKGNTIDYIINNFTGLTKRELAAFKAHITMGTYEEGQENLGNASKIDKLPSNKKRSKIENPFLSRGIIFYDSNQKRLTKNVERTVSAHNITPVSRLKSFDIFKGLEWYIGRRIGAFTINSYDSRSTQAMEMITNHALESRFYHNLIFIGSPSDSLIEEIDAAKSLGAKIRLGVFDSSISTIDPSQPLVLEDIVFSRV